MKLDFFIIYSSFVSIFGTFRQANYSAASAFADNLALYRICNNQRALAINWGGWSEIGIAAKFGSNKILEKRGIGSISTAAGVEILEKLIFDNSGQVGVVPVNMEIFSDNWSE